MAELSSEDKAKYIKIRDGYKQLKINILETLNNKSGNDDTEYHSVNTNGYKAILTGLSFKINLANASESIKEEHAKTTGLVGAIDVIDKQIRTNIESLLVKGRPSIPGAEQECIPCDMKSVFFMGRVPQGGDGPDSHYECALCGRNNLSENFRYDKKNW